MIKLGKRQKCNLDVYLQYCWKPLLLFYNYLNCPTKKWHLEVLICIIRVVLG